MSSLLLVHPKYRRMIIPGLLAVLVLVVIVAALMP